ncbi:hypothetical protein M0R45_030469 [Rubus argutus]|uniref:Uncharacterized protein n=1 Tax=Rubus argutus TaxID=59490 RepID=A0AAW1WAS6_RUBAR
MVEFLLCCRWLRRKAKRDAFKPAILDDVKRFIFRPYFSIKSFQVYPFYYSEDQSWACPGLTSMFLTTTLHHLPTYGDRFEPIVVKYSPQRVRRQFGVNQDVPIGGFAYRTAKSIIVSFIKHDENSRKSMFSNCLGTQEGMRAHTPAYKKFWELQLCEFGKFIRLGGSVSRCHELPSKNRRLISSKTVMGITSKHNLTYVETYSNDMKHLVEKKKDNRKVPYFKSKLSKDYVSFTSDSGVRMMLSPDALPSKKGKKRKVISGSKASYTPTKKKVKLSDRKVVCENSSSGDSYNEGERANSTETDNSCNESGRDDTNASEENSYYENEGSDLGASEEEFSKESHEDIQDTSTQELVNQCGEVRSSDVEAGMKVASCDEVAFHDETISCEIGVGREVPPRNEMTSCETGAGKEDVILDDVLLEPIVMFDSSDGNYNEQDGPTSSTIRESSKEVSGNDITGIVTSVGGGGSVDHWATRIENFMTNFESRDRSSITLDDITPPLSGSQSVFEEDCCKEVCRLERAVLELKSQLVNLECQLGKAQEELHSKLGGVISSDNLVCILRSSWTPQSRAIHGLY